MQWSYFEQEERAGGGGGSKHVDVYCLAVRITAAVCVQLDEIITYVCPFFSRRNIGIFTEFGGGTRQGQNEWRTPRREDRTRQDTIKVLHTKTTRRRLFIGQNYSLQMTRSKDGWPKRGGRHDFVLILAGKLGS